MPTSNPTGYETYIYDHKMYSKSNEDTRQFLGKLHDPTKLPPPIEVGSDAPLIMVEPSYLLGSTDVFIFFKNQTTFALPRFIAEQLRDALIKVCEKPNGT